MIKHGDLKYVLHNTCEIGMYDPKSGTSKEVIVLSFRIKEEDALKDTCFFIEYIPCSNYISSTHSTFPDDDGYYTVFVELENNEKTFDQIIKIIKQVYKNLADHENCTIVTYPNKEHVLEIS